MKFFDFSLHQTYLVLVSPGWVDLVKGSDRQCMVVELNVQYCGKIFRIHLRHIKRFYDVYLLSFSSKSWICLVIKLRKLKLTVIIEKSNLIQLLISKISHYSQRFSGIFIKKTTFEEFVEICEQIHKNKKFNIMIK